MVFFFEILKFFKHFNFGFKINMSPIILLQLLGFIIKCHILSKDNIYSHAFSSAGQDSEEISLDGINHPSGKML